MAEDRAEPREATWRTLMPWTELFRGFQIALDLNKLLLAAAGLVATAAGWWLLAFVFGAGYKATPPVWTSGTTVNEDSRKEWRKFKSELDDWNLMHKAAGVGTSAKATARVEAVDLADSVEEYAQINNAVKARDDALARITPEQILKIEETSKLTLDAALLKQSLEKEGIDPAKASRDARLLGTVKPSSLMATMPWFEDRGPNPFMLATGQMPAAWETGHFWEWFAFGQAPVLIEPLVKFLRPIIYFFSPQASGTARFYFLCVMIWTLAVWSLFGGAITRIAAVQIARNERIGMSEAVRFTMKRLVYYVTAPLFPLVFVLGLLILMIIFGYFFMIPMFGDVVVAGLFWWGMIGFGLLMAIALVGLVGWPLMAATISTEGTDSWEAVSRSYTYVFQKPWQYVWYSLVAICYGAAVVFFIGFMGSFMVYLSKWGVSQTFGIRAADREPSFLFVYAPTSFGWRTLLLDGVVVDQQKLVQDGEIRPSVYNKYVGYDETYKGADKLTWYNKIGAGLVAVWVGLLFLLVLGFGYSFFWSSATIIYLLMRKNVDTAELDEVYLEEDDQEGAYGGPLAPPPAPAAPAPAPAPKTTQLHMVEAPLLKAPAPVTPAVATPSPTAPTETPVAPDARTLISPTDPLLEPTPKPSPHPTDGNSGAPPS